MPTTQLRRPARGERKAPPPRGPRDPQGRMPLGEHLRELRTRLLVCLLALAVGAVAGWLLFDPVWDLLKRPYCALPQSHRLGPGCALVVTGLFDAFFVKLKVALVIGAVVSCPVWLYQLWAFVAPGLHRRERRWAYGFVGAAVPLFLLGAGIAYFVLDRGLRFFLALNPTNVVTLLTVTDYLRYVQATLLVFGASFEFPLVLVGLNLAGVLTFARMRASWRVTVFGIFAVSAVACPTPDAFTMTAMALLLCVLYVCALGIAWVHDRRLPPSEFADLGDDEASPLAG